MVKMQALDVLLGNEGQIRKGCDASILINGPLSEKTAGPNLSVRGYEFIDTLKGVAEAKCPDVVSCADIIAIATTELIKLGGGPVYSVQTGRRDGLVSNAQDVRIPNPSGSVTESGGHTVGKSHCSFFQDRLYGGTSQFDLNMDSNLRQQLRLTCPRGTASNNFTFLDQNPQSSSKFDNSYFDQLLKGRGILPIDQALSRNPLTSGFVRQFAQNGALFNTKFVRAMIKMQALDVLLGDQGQIRKGCDASILFYGPSTEKFAGPNLSVRGNKFIDSLKDIAEEECTGVVSCADIIAIATKKLIKMGGGPDYLVQTGRRDGLISEAQDVSLPSPFGSVRQSILAFGDKNFSPEEMVALFGTHTVGISQCNFFQDRLYQGTSEFDPKMDPNLRRQLIPTCPQGTNSNNFTFLDQNSQSSNKFDSSFFDQILKQRRILKIDQDLVRDP
uniref:peroxidase n=1 Tax=Chenopodium quinoa TaxID=63459 RepID=A0A803LVC6_CHEQI